MFWYYPALLIWQGNATVTIKFDGRHFKKEIILQAVRWYVAYSLSYRDVEEIMEERGVNVDHVTIRTDSSSMTRIRELGK